MAVNAGPKIETNGLVYSIDPGNSKSYNINGGSTTFFNSVSGLTGNGNLRTGAAIARRFGGVISLDGLNDYVTLPLKANWCPQDIYGYSSISFEFWVYLNDINDSFFLSRYYNSGTGNKSITLTKNGTLAILARTFYATYSIPTNWSFSNDVWYHIVLTISPTQAILYKDATQSFSANHGVTLAYNGTFDSMNDEGIGIGCGVLYNYPPYTDSSSLQGYVGIINVYNKVLTQDEIKTNYNTMKGRYNV
jgi:hypothetical protein